MDFSWTFLRPCSLSLNFCTFPVEVRGNEFTKKICVGILKMLILSRQKSITSFSLPGFVQTLPLFFICCIIDSIINRTAKPLGQADMFYISPYYPSAQVVFHEIALNYGISIGNAVYLSATCLGGFLFHIIFCKFRLLSARTEN